MTSNPEGLQVFTENSQWFNPITFEDILRFMPSGGLLFIQWLVDAKVYSPRKLEKIKKEISDYYNIPYEQFQENWNNHIYINEELLVNRDKMLLNTIIRGELCTKKK
jgi:hypothetical protein